MHGRFELDADHAQLFDSALKAARDRLFNSGATQVTWVEALIEMAQQSLDAQTLERRERFRVNLFIDPTENQSARWTDGTAIPDCIRRLTECDGTLTPVFVKDGRPVSVGRAQRIVPERTRRIVLHRDHGSCRSPWCSNSRWLQVHHVVHWEDGGPTDTPNLVALCPWCHRAHHRGCSTSSATPMTPTACGSSTPTATTSRDRRPTDRRYARRHPAADTSTRPANACAPGTSSSGGPASPPGSPDTAAPAPTSPNISQGSAT
ncbi:MAG: HNH endonuclease [Acidimicrobiia bacterium]|nr:HNH endonuclease [Acidimicrobiia bacterium]